MQKTLIKSLLLIIAFTFALSANYIFAVWTGPTQTPPGGNTPTPVHVGATAQVKDAGLSLNSLAVFGNGFFDGNVGIGTAGPNAKLELFSSTGTGVGLLIHQTGVRWWDLKLKPNDGSLYFTDRSAGIDRMVIDTTGNVGIGTTAPSAGGEQPLKLDVEGAIGAKYYCDENGNNCTSAPLGGGGGDSRFGGLYQHDGTASKTCMKTNPQTGSCSCPSGFTAYLSGQTNTNGHDIFICQK